MLPVWKRDRRAFDDFGANAEVGPSLRSCRSWRDDDIVVLVEHSRLELGPIIGHKARRAHVDLGEEVEDVERELIRIVDEQCPDHARLLIHSDQSPNESNRPCVVKVRQEQSYSTDESNW